LIPSAGASRAAGTDGAGSGGTAGAGGSTLRGFFFVALNQTAASLGIERGPIRQGETELPPVLEAGSLAERAAQAERALQRPGRRSRVRNRKAW
jgi:hypothetical protein